VIPKLTLRPEQEEAVQRILAEPTRAALVGSQPGAGKTLLSLEVALRLWPDLVLIMGVKETFDQFAPRLLAQSDSSISLRRIDATKAGQVAMADYLASTPGWYFVGSEYLSAKDHELIPQFHPDGSPVIGEKGQYKDRQVKKKIRLKTWEKVTPDIIICDESHRNSTRHANSHNTLKGLRSTWKIAMSGTPAGNRFENFHGITSWLWPDLVEKSFALWKSKWCRTESQYIPGGRAIQKVIGEKNPGEYVKTLPCYIRHEVLEPVPKAEVIEVDLTTEQMRVYSDLEEQLLSWVKDHPLSIDWPVTLQGYLRLVTLAEPTVNPETGKIQFDEGSPSAKFDATMALLSGRWAGENVFIGTHSQRWAARLTQLLNSAGVHAEEYSGRTSPKDRARIKQQFSEGKIRVLVAVIAATKLGLDGMQLNCCKLLTHSISVGDFSGMEQYARRVWRPGNPRLDEFEHVILAGKGTIETGLYRNNELQTAEQHRTLRLAA
jgi:superfamily II DNA or RNA helicase